VAVLFNAKEKSVFRRCRKCFEKFQLLSAFEGGLFIMSAIVIGMRGSAS
jgi:hypothetical protein